jgi:TetR/AcrR family transcriptional regulator
MATHSKSAEPRRGSRRQPEASRNAILKAALAEFAQKGLAGARVDAIADAAGVNKALLYYYFHDKETLYGATLENFFAPLHQRIMDVCDRPGPAGERFLHYAREHFDSIAASPHHGRIFMSELMSASRGGKTHLDQILTKYMFPIGMRVLALLQEGVDSGEFRPVDPAQFMPTAIGSIVHYFLTAPLRQRFLKLMPMPEASIDDRRAAVLDFIAAALFADRAAGIALAAVIGGAHSSDEPVSEPALSRTKGKRP